MEQTPSQFVEDNSPIKILPTAVAMLFVEIYNSSSAAAAEKTGKILEGRSFTILSLPILDTGFTVLVGGELRATGRPPDISDPLALLVGAPHISNAVPIAWCMLAWLV